MRSARMDPQDRRKPQKASGSYGGNREETRQTSSRQAEEDDVGHAQQNDIFLDQVETHARRSDPKSSHIAARENKANRRDWQIQETVAALHKHANVTSLELAVLTGLCRFMLARRLPDAEKKELVIRGSERMCRISRRPAVTWRLA